MVRVSLLPLVMCLLWQTGCSTGPGRVAAPSWSPAASAERAMELWDTDKSGGLDAEELLQCPGLASDLGTIDSNRDGILGRDELQARLADFEQTRAGLKVETFLITLDGKPLAGATVTFVPEEFLAGILESATGKTTSGGVVKPKAESADLRAMQLGFYRVEIESPEITTDAQRQSIRKLGTTVSPYSYDRRTLAIKE